MSCRDVPRSRLRRGPGNRARKDTVVVRPMQLLEVDFDAHNPGQWAAHCHNVYHAEAGVMTAVSYRA